MYSMCQIIWSTIKQTNTLSGSLCLNTSCDELITVHFIRPRVTLPLETSPFAPRSPRLMATVRWCVSSGKASQSPGLKETAANTQKVQDMWINLAVWGPDVLCAQRWWSKSALRLTYFAEVEANLQVWAWKSSSIWFARLSFWKKDACRISRKEPFRIYKCTEISSELFSARCTKKTHFLANPALPPALNPSSSGVHVETVCGHKKERLLSREIVAAPESLQRTR